MKNSYESIKRLYSFEINFYMFTLNMCYVARHARRFAEKDFNVHVNWIVSEMRVFQNKFAIAGRFTDKCYRAALALAKHLLGDDRFMLTIFCGINTTAEECVLMEDTLRASNPDVEIYTIDAGQDIYPYIFVAE
jgi:dihydroxyacetone kinase-like predicted kinase